MAAKRPARKADPIATAAVEYFSARSHDAWRRNLLKTNPEQKGKPRMRLRGGVMVDVNQPWSRLHPKAQTDNKRAAYDAYEAVCRHPDDREAAAARVHAHWIRRNKRDPNQPKELFKPYAELSEVEKDKDRAHVDRMKAALAAVRRQKDAKPAKTRKPKRTTARTAVEVDTRVWRRLETAAEGLSAALGRKVAPEALLAAGAEAMIALSKSLGGAARAKKT